MFIEFIVLLAFFVVGFSILKLVNLKGIIVIPFSFTIGTVFFTILGYLTAIINIKYNWFYPLGFFGFVLPISLLAFLYYKNKLLIKPLHLCLFAVVLFIIVAIFYNTHLFKFHFDFYRYLFTGVLIVLICNCFIQLQVLVV